MATTEGENVKPTYPVRDGAPASAADGPPESVRVAASDPRLTRCYRSSSRLAVTASLVSVGAFVVWAVLTEYGAGVMAHRWGPVTVGIVVYLAVLLGSVAVCRAYVLARRRIDADIADIVRGAR